MNYRTTWSVSLRMFALSNDELPWKQFISFITKLVDHGLQDLSIQLRNMLKNGKDVWDWQNLFFNSLSLECESIAVTSLSITTQENMFDRFAILLSFLVFIFCFKYMQYKYPHTVDVPLLKWWEKPDGRRQVCSVPV